MNGHLEFLIAAPHPCFAVCLGIEFPTIPCTASSNHHADHFPSTLKPLIVPPRMTENTTISIPQNQAPIAFVLIRLPETQLPRCPVETSDQCQFLAGMNSTYQLFSSAAFLCQIQLQTQGNIPFL